MSGMLMLAAWLTPLAALPAALSRNGGWLLAAAPLPALAAALLVPGGAEASLPWLLLGVHLAFDATGALFLLFSSLLWASAGLYTVLRHGAEAHARRFRVLFLLAMAGNLLLILAADAVSFYLGFALMGISAYGLVVHRGSWRARRAGRIYLAWTLVGEVALFSALLLLTAGGEALRFADLPARELPAAAVALLLFGFGIKLALPGLHVWLPLSYAAAPAAGAAVLSGPMISAGLLGWLRFLPPQAPGLAGWGAPLLAVGAAGIALGVLAGLAQRDPRALLGYSSIAKMGLITALFGSALLHPQAAPAIVSALVLFAMHHLLVKGALFLGVGEWRRAGRRAWVLAGVAVLALALAGAPLTGGAALKSALSEALAGVGAELEPLLALSAFGTVLLMSRLVWLLTRATSGTSAALDAAGISWLLLALAASWLPVLAAGAPLSASGILPLAAGVALAAPLWMRARRPPRRRVAPGDVLYLIPWRTLRGLLPRVPSAARRPLLAGRWPPIAPRATSPSLAVSGVLWLGVVLALALTLLVSGPAPADAQGVLAAVGGVL